MAVSARSSACVVDTPRSVKVWMRSRSLLACKACACVRSTTAFVRSRAASAAPSRSSASRRLRGSRSGAGDGMIVATASLALTESPALSLTRVSRPGSGAAIT
jgi:hypothetical protein